MPSNITRTPLIIHTLPTYLPLSPLSLRSSLSSLPSSPLLSLSPSLSPKHHTYIAIQYHTHTTHYTYTPYSNSPSTLMVMMINNQVTTNQYCNGNNSMDTPVFFNIYYKTNTKLLSLKHRSSSLKHRSSSVVPDDPIDPGSTPC